MEALPIDTFNPMDQLGWARAISAVTLAICSRDQVRNGPPEAVSTMRSTACLCSPVRHWKIALCSLSTGISLPPPCLTVRRKTSPAETRHSLLASAISAPRRAAVNVGARPGVPAIAAITQPASIEAASSRPDLPAATLMPVPESADFSASYLSSSAVTASSAPNSRACSARRVMLPAPVSAMISNWPRPPS